MRIVAFAGIQACQPNSLLFHQRGKNLNLITRSFQVEIILFCLLSLKFLGRRKINKFFVVVDKYWAMLKV